MEKQWIEGTFIQRLNRFSAIVQIQGDPTTCHVANTARLKELLVPNAGVRVMLTLEDQAKRKTKFTLRKVHYMGIWVSIDSSEPNNLVEEWLRQGVIQLEGPLPVDLKREYTLGASRFDIFERQRNLVIEVKGVSLVEGGIAKFPDAPTTRGVKHLNHLAHLAHQGYSTSVYFVIQRSDASEFMPNRKQDPDFAEALARAHLAGVQIRCFVCNVLQAKTQYLKEIPFKL